MTRLPNTGDFGIKASSGPWMWLERIGTFSRYGHACVAVTPAVAGRVTIVEADTKGAPGSAPAPSPSSSGRTLI